MPSKIFFEKRFHFILNEQKYKIVNVNMQATRFMGFRMRLHVNGKKSVITSHINEYMLKTIKDKLKKQIYKISTSSQPILQHECDKYNHIVMDIHKRFKFATNIAADCGLLSEYTRQIFKTKLHGTKLVRYSKNLNIKNQYSKSEQLRYLAGTNIPIYPIGYAAHKNPMGRKRDVCKYTPIGRSIIFSMCQK